MPESTPSLIEAARQRPWYRLRLPADLESRFAETTRRSRATYIQSWLLVFMVFNVISLKMDFDQFGPDRFAVPAFLTLGVFLPSGLLAILALHGLTSARRQAGIVAGIALLDMAIVLNSARIAPAAHADTYLILAVIVPMAVGMIAPLSFRHSLVLCGSAFGLYATYVVGFVLPRSEATGLPLLIAGLTLVPIKLAYSREWTCKEAFLLTLEKSARDVDLAAANARLTILSETDSLTGLRNRRSATARLQTGWAEASHEGGWVMLALIDIDAFKRLNDTAGHPAGDRCLRQVAQALETEAALHGAQLARYGGEEFILFLSGVEPVRATAIGESLRRAIERLAYPHPGLPDGAYVTVSIGVAAAHGSLGALGIGAADLLKAADDALYCAKRGGRNRVESARLSPASANSDLVPASALG
ncbi:desulfoferrodoxin [Methylobacterium sp. Leaf104]|uniref:GGDEF domain-containing protein n=1 Tax=Methylobacterium TaxID=407 RepID=UPI0006F2389F|nr:MULTISPECIES: diguanylate cyclase [Methylobacterium]KQP42819.1 desulfoferrodoxin [Methylobacterium sp. Leaf104]MCI9878596.1 GGDEF domain-containing protein [Methylobacterium goesingense]